MADSPTHLLAKAGDRRSLCGVKDALPRVLVQWAAAHQANYGLVVCADCEAVLDDDDPLEDAHGYSRSDLLFGGNW